jgi:dihydrolipoamide dehydrogenase
VFGIEGDATMNFVDARPQPQRLGRHRQGVHFLMKEQDPEIDGWGTLTGDKSSTSDDKSERYCDNPIIATGATTRLIPGTSLWSAWSPTRSRSSPTTCWQHRDRRLR